MATFLILLASVLWLLLCLRFWLMIDRKNTWQRRIIAVAAGLGAGMIYILGTLMWNVVKAPEIQGIDIRVAPSRASKAAP